MFGIDNDIRQFIIKLRNGFFITISFAILNVKKAITKNKAKYPSVSLI